MNKKGGPHKDSPLLCLCYSRAVSATSDPLATARLLLERGADPNAHYFTHGTYRFTCVTGAIGEGEGGVAMYPPHSRAPELVTLLLEAGANPNDGQGLYNSMFSGGTHWIELLIEHGLKQGDLINWSERDGVTTLDYLLAHAAKKDMIDRVELLLKNGADPNCIDWYEKRPCYELALSSGNTRVVELLTEYGAEKIEPASPEQRFYNACMAADREEIELLRKQFGDEKTMRWARSNDKNMGLAADSGKVAAIELMLELGFPMGRALFDSAWHGHLEIAKTLVKNGASACQRDPHHGVTPIAFADRAGHTDVVEYLLKQDIDIFDAIRFGTPQQLEDLLAADPSSMEHLYEDYAKTKSAWSFHTPLIHAVVLAEWTTSICC